MQPISEIDKQTDQSTEVSKDLTTIIERGQFALRMNPDQTLAELAAAITEEVPTFWTMPGQVIPFPDVPAPVIMTKEIQEALEALPEVFGKVNIEKRRTLTPEEITQVFDEHEALGALQNVLQDRRDNLKEYVRTHLDVDAEEENRAIPADVFDAEGNKIAEASPRDPHGHYVLGEKGSPERLNVPGTNKAFSREASSYKASISGDRLLELYEAGEISREDYLAFTREVRIFDENKARQAIHKDPRLLGLLARITQRGGMKSALFVRKAK
jgi:hypothetical protein